MPIFSLDLNVNIIYKEVEPYGLPQKDIVSTLRFPILVPDDPGSYRVQV